MAVLAEGQFQKLRHLSPSPRLDVSSPRRLLSSHSAAGASNMQAAALSDRGGEGNVRKDGDGLPRMQNTRRPLPSALPVAKVKGSGSSHCLRPLRLHLPSSSLAVRPARSAQPKPPAAKKELRPKMPGQVLFFLPPEHARPVRCSAMRHCYPLASAAGPERKPQRLQA